MKDIFVDGTSVQTSQRVSGLSAITGPGPVNPGTTRFRVLSDAAAWQRLPPAARGGGQSLPTWARMLADELPRTTASLLELDLAQRVNSPIPAALRAAMRWVAADANRCDYALAYAAADGLRAGISEARLDALRQGNLAGWSNGEKAALEFSRKMSVDSDSVTDQEFADLVSHFGEKIAACMVLLMAYANFQDRLLLCLAAPLETGGALPPIDAGFDPKSFVLQTTPPMPIDSTSQAESAGKTVVDIDATWAQTSYDVLQQRLEAQRVKPTRLPVPAWDEVARNLPDGLLKGPSDIVWYRIVFAYAPELAIPFERFMRTAGAEASSKWDRIFAQCLFWLTTKAVKCSYCMGHCEMNFEVAGLSAAQVEQRTRLLASDDWSSFLPREQHAFAFVQRLSSAPWSISDNDVALLCDDFGVDRAIILLLNASRYHYMTRISNGFQLTLERDNVFYSYYNVRSDSVPAPAMQEAPNVPLLSIKDCWQRMPATVSGGGQTLPNWVRGLVAYLPRTAAAMLQLDLAHRTQSPLDPVLRAKMRWVIAHANRCPYSEAYALADLKRAGLQSAAIPTLTGDERSWPEEDREPLEFARLLTVAAPTIADELFGKLRLRFGDKGVAAMVLLAAYGNFQDRIVLGLNLPLEVGGPLPPLDIQFTEDAFQIAPLYPTHSALAPLATAGQRSVFHDPDWSAIPYEELQARLERQRQREPRLPIPTWDDCQRHLPAVMTSRPTRIVWSLVCLGYVPELAVPWSITTRTMWAETKPDRVFEESLFWIQTRSIECNYCMGHCEMLLEVAGLDKSEIAERTSRLAGSDWSIFPPVEQRAYAYARKLSKTPWQLTSSDYHVLESDLGPDKAMATFWWLCRGLYMTRVSDGFQLPLERENVFADPVHPQPAAPPPMPAASR